MGFGMSHFELTYYSFLTWMSTVRGQGEESMEIFAGIFINVEIVAEVDDVGVVMLSYDGNEVRKR